MDVMFLILFCIRIAVTVCFAVGGNDCPVHNRLITNAFYKVVDPRVCSAACKQQVAESDHRPSQCTMHGKICVQTVTPADLVTVYGQCMVKTPRQTCQPNPQKPVVVLHDECIEESIIDPCSNISLDLNGHVTLQIRSVLPQPYQCPCSVTSTNQQAFLMEAMNLFPFNTQEVHQTFLKVWSAEDVLFVENIRLFPAKHRADRASRLFILFQFNDSQPKVRQVLTVRANASFHLQCGAEWDAFVESDAAVSTRAVVYIVVTTLTVLGLLLVTVIVLLYRRRRTTTNPAATTTTETSLRQSQSAVSLTDRARAASPLVSMHCDDGVMYTVPVDTLHPAPPKRARAARQIEPLSYTGADYITIVRG